MPSEVTTEEGRGEGKSEEFVHDTFTPTRRRPLAQLVQALKECNSFESDKTSFLLLFLLLCFTNTFSCFTNNKIFALGQFERERENERESKRVKVRNIQIRKKCLISI